MAAAPPAAALSLLLAELAPHLRDAGSEAERRRAEDLARQALQRDAEHRVALDIIERSAARFRAPPSSAAPAASGAAPRAMAVGAQAEATDPLVARARAHIERTRQQQQQPSQPRVAVARAAAAPVRGAQRPRSAVSALGPKWLQKIRAETRDQTLRRQRQLAQREADFAARRASSSRSPQQPEAPEDPLVAAARRRIEQSSEWRARGLARAAWTLTKKTLQSRPSPRS
jgi:hypothetical protein